MISCHYQCSMKLLLIVSKLTKDLDRSLYVIFTLSIEPLMMGTRLMAQLSNLCLEFDRFPAPPPSLK